MAASSPLHRDASASRQPSSHSLHGITASNAALPSHKHEGLVGPLRPWSGSRSCGAPPRPLSLPFARASRADARTKTGVCARAVRAHPCPWICQAATMRRTGGIKNKIRTRVERREKPSDRLPPYELRLYCERLSPLAVALPDACAHKNMKQDSGVRGTVTTEHPRGRPRPRLHRRCK